jgi:uncharacterized membrane protein YbhN (UPF0104 family)
MAVEPLAAKWVRAIAVSTAIAAALYLGAVLWAGHASVAAAIRLVGVDAVTAVLGLSLVNYGLRFVRWHYYIRWLGGRISLGNDLRIYVGGFALTTTPGKAGEMARSVWLRPYGVPATMSLAAFFAERLQDVLAIVLLSGLVVARFRGGGWILSAGAGLVLIALSALCTPPLFRRAAHFVETRRGTIRRLALRLSDILVLARGCFGPPRFIIGLLLGVAAWGAEGAALYAIMVALGHPLAFLPAVGIFAFATLAGALSLMPGGLGGTEATMVLLLRLFAVPLPIAVSATLLVQVATLWFAVFLGIVALSIKAKAGSNDAIIPPSARPEGG